MSYYKLGTNCEPATIALTSNSKFLQPLSSLYNIHYKITDKTLIENKYENKKEEKANKEILKDLSNLQNRVEKIKQFGKKSCSTC